VRRVRVAPPEEKQGVPVDRDDGVQAADVVRPAGGELRVATLTQVADLQS
jgi:hypothetical protein